MRPQEVQPFADALALRQIGEKGGEILFIGGGQRGVAINELDDVIALVHAMLDQRIARERADDVNAGHRRLEGRRQLWKGLAVGAAKLDPHRLDKSARRSEEHTSELQSLMRISYAVFCLKKKHKTNKDIQI